MQAARRLGFCGCVVVDWSQSDDPPVEPGRGIYVIIDYNLLPKRQVPLDLSKSQNTTTVLTQFSLMGRWGGEWRQVHASLQRAIPGRGPDPLGRVHKGGILDEHICGQALRGAVCIGIRGGSASNGIHPRATQCGSFGRTATQGDLGYPFLVRRQLIAVRVCS